MTQIASLGLAIVGEADEKELCYSIGKMEHLHNLHLYAPFGLKRLDALSSSPPYLEKLFLNGVMKHAPHWFDGLHSLTHLTMTNSQLGEDLISQIQELPNLTDLRLGDDAYNQKRLCFHEGFRKLRLLHVIYCSSLNEIVIEDGVMPGLQYLHVYNCKELRGFSYGADRLTHLKEVYLYDVSDELTRRLCEEGKFKCLTTGGILYTRDDDDELESEWFYQIFY